MYSNLLCSGMLTGKFKRNSAPNPKDGRAGYLEAMRREGKPTWSYWDDVANDDTFWNLLDIMKQVADKKCTNLKYMVYYKKEHVKCLKHVALFMTLFSFKYVDLFSMWSHSESKVLTLINRIEPHK